MSFSDEVRRRFGERGGDSPAASGSRVEKLRLAAAMRRVIEGLVVSDAPEEELARAADALERYADRLATHPRSAKYQHWAETSPAGSATSHFDQSPLIGLANPLSPPILLEANEATRSVRGRVVFGSAYEGPPGCVHGGFIAAAFDEVLGLANTLSRSPGMTAMLRVNYRLPTPLHTELRFEARLERVDGRKIYTSGQVYAGDRLTADADGLFVAVDRERFMQLFEERERREHERSAGPATGDEPT